MNQKGNILASFIEQASRDDRLLPSHLALFTAIYHLLTQGSTEDTVKVTRKKVMNLAKINSISTYHRCIADLVAFNYIVYRPTFDHYQGSLVIFGTE